MEQTIQRVRYMLQSKLTVRQLIKPTQLPLTRWALYIIFLPYEALLMLGAIRTTLTRLLIARKNLLQWTTAAKAARLFGSDPKNETLREMTPSLVFSVALTILVAILKPDALWVAAPLLILWLVAPQIAYVISKPAIRITTPLSEP